MTTKTDNITVCSHCLLKFNKNTAIVENEDGKELHFCCPGCQSVYHIIKDGGFDSFYKKRRDFKPGPVELMQVSEDIFLDDLITSDDCFELDFIATNIRCAACIWLIENYLSKLEGVLYVRANYATHRVKIKWDPAVISLNKILNGIANLGYAPVPVSAVASSDYFKEQKKAYFYRFAVAAFFTMQIMIYSIALYAGYFQGIDENLKRMFKFIAMILATPIVFYSGLPFAINTFKSLKAKTLNMDTLVFMGSYSAYFYSIFAVFTDREIYFDTSAMIITLILLGRYIEIEARIKASKEISLLFNLQPKQAKLIKNFDIESYKKGLIKPQIVKSSDIKCGDIIEILPGENIPVDGEIVYGESDVDESMFTGESIPVFKKTGSNIISGTSNLNGTIIIKATSDSRSSTLSKIADAIKKAQESKFYFQKLADQITVYFVPFVIFIAVFTFFFWFYNMSQIVTPLMNAISVLVIACPCAMGLATPLAVLIASSTLFKNGILIKDGLILENTNKVKSVFFDKTGTITEGFFSIVNIKSYDSEVELLQVAASVERFSKHVIARSIVKSYDKDFIPIIDAKEIPGFGIVGLTSDKKQILAGNKGLMEKHEITIDKNIEKDITLLSQKGYTNILIAFDKNIIGIISLFDQVKPAFSNVYKFLQKVKLDQFVITGDTFETAKTVLKDYPHLKIFSSLTPADKVEIVKNHLDKFPLTVGDGINDAAALKQSFIGLSMGKGTDIAMESSDGVLMNSDISLLIKFFKISQKTRKIIIENLFWAFSYNFITIPLAVMGKIHPVFSAILMSISSLLVVFNSLRIK
jgi:heavy metal translocating P-type ATPase